MKQNKTIVALTIAALALAVVSTITDDVQARVTSDPVNASFERDFGHQATPAAPAVRADIDSDELYQLVNEPHWSADDSGQGAH